MLADEASAGQIPSLALRETGAVAIIEAFLALPAVLFRSVGSSATLSAE